MRCHGLQPILGSLCDFLKSNVVTWDELCKIAQTMASGLTHLHEELPKYGKKVPEIKKLFKCYNSFFFHL